ncbi:TPA: phage tail protein [Morganella morganii]
MTAKYFAILTNYGAAQLANAVALGTQMNISAMAVGDGGGTLPVPDPAQTKLVRETRRAAVNQVSIDEKNPNFIIAEQVIPENEGGWFIREIGLFDDNGGLIAVGNTPETYKPNLQEGSGRTQVIQMVLMVSSTQAITLKVDPSVVLATREYVTKSIDAAIQESETKAAKIYATKTELSTGLSGKQPTGDYATKTELNNGLSGKQPTGDYATKTEVNSKLTKNENGADIPDKPKFIENLGLPELLDKKFDKTGGAITTTSKAIDIITEAKNAGYIQISDSTGNIIHQLGKISSDNGLALRNVAEDGTLTISGDGARFNGRLLGFINEALNSGNGWWRDSSTGLLIQWGETPAGSDTRQVKFPIPFRSWPHVVVHFDAGWFDHGGATWGVVDKSLSGFTGKTSEASEGGAFIGLGF